MSHKLKNKKGTVFVGLSGGVDSSVSAALLKNEGYKVVGVFIRTWTPDFIDCTWRSERRDAMRVAAHLDIPFLECDLEKEYKEGVADYMIREYKEGRTPNPDVACNREVKFGAFWKWAKAKGADYIATGHYAQNKIQKNSNTLQMGADPAKDQSYFLWTLQQEDLAHILFPVGGFKKPYVRKLAEKYGLPTAEKKDSQGVCFLGPLDMKDFLSHYIHPKKGVVLDRDGMVIGEHDGAVFLTLGTRHGFTVTKKTATEAPYYVVAKDILKNTVTVSHEKLSLLDTAGSTISLTHTNWISGIPGSKKYRAQIRYHGEFLPVTIAVTGETSADIIFKKPELVSPGQSIVIFDGAVCVGGGVVA